MARRIIITEDGSESIYDEDLRETYHSTRGARAESSYVFIEQGLDYFLDNRELSILEVGMGTGLNVWLTMKWADSNARNVQMITLEPFPLSEYEWKGLSMMEDGYFRSIHEHPWNTDIQMSERLRFRKLKAALENFEDEATYDVVFFDAFAPSKQPDIWDIHNLEKCYNLLQSDGILTTYCAQGQFKRNLQSVGFTVEVLPGALGKKEMVRGIKS